MAFKISANFEIVTRYLLSIFLYFSFIHSWHWKYVYAIVYTQQSILYGNGFVLCNEHTYTLHLIYSYRFFLLENRIYYHWTFILTSFPLKFIEISEMSMIAYVYVLLHIKLLLFFIRYCSHKMRLKAVETLKLYSQWNECKVGYCGTCNTLK